MSNRVAIDGTIYSQSIWAFLTECRPLKDFK